MIDYLIDLLVIDWLVDEFTNPALTAPCLSSSDHHSGPHRIVDKLFSNTRYFVMKSNNHENIAIAKDRVRIYCRC